MARRRGARVAATDPSGVETRRAFYPWRVAGVTATVALLVLAAMTLAMAGVGWGFGLVLVAGIVLLAARRKGPRGGRAAFRKLLALCHNDESLAERLILAEIRRKPDLSRSEATEAAIDKLLSDRR